MFISLLLGDMFTWISVLRELYSTDIISYFCTINPKARRWKTYLIWCPCGVCFYWSSSSSPGGLVSSSLSLSMSLGVRDRLREAGRLRSAGERDLNTDKKEGYQINRRIDCVFLNLAFSPGPWSWSALVRIVSISAVLGPGPTATLVLSWPWTGASPRRRSVTPRRLGPRSGLGTRLCAGAVTATGTGSWATTAATRRTGAWAGPLAGWSAFFLDQPNLTTVQFCSVQFLHGCFQVLGAISNIFRLMFGWCFQHLKKKKICFWPFTCLYFYFRYCRK